MPSAKTRDTVRAIIGLYANAYRSATITDEDIGGGRKHLYGVSLDKIAAVIDVAIREAVEAEREACAQIADSRSRLRKARVISEDYVATLESQLAAATARAEQAEAVVAELVAAMDRYSAAQDESAPYFHREMMDRARAALSPTGAPAHESAQEQFERIADQFHSDTGYLRPGKDVSPELAYADYEAERRAAWNRWIAEHPNVC